MSSCLITPSMIARYELMLLSRCLDAKYGNSENEPAFIASVDVPFSVADRTMSLDDYMQVYGSPSAQRLMDELIYAKTFYELPVDHSYDMSANHRFDGISLRYGILYNPITDIVTARIEVAYSC